MAIVQNNRENDFEINLIQDGQPVRIVIKGGAAVTEVDDTLLKEALKNRAITGWFDDGHLSVIKKVKEPKESTKESKEAA